MTKLLKYSYLLPNPSKGYVIPRGCITCGHLQSELPYHTDEHPYTEASLPWIVTDSNGKKYGAFYVEAQAKSVVDTLNTMLQATVPPPS